MKSDIIRDRRQGHVRFITKEEQEKKPKRQTISELWKSKPNKEKRLVKKFQLHLMIESMRNQQEEDTSDFLRNMDIDYPLDELQGFHSK